MKPMKCDSLMNKDGTLNLDKILWPKLASPKFDGNRCYVADGQAKSSSGKPIKNDHIRRILSHLDYEGFDGELIVGSPTASNVRRATHSGVSRKDGTPDFTFYVFDDHSLKGSFEDRSHQVLKRINKFRGRPVQHVSHTLLEDLEELEAYEAKVISQGYEGVVLRDPYAPYKQGRSTLRENWALKLKRFVDAEAIVIGYYERMHNDNPQTRNDHGKAERSSHKENLRPAGDLGGLEVRDLVTGVEFRIGTGWSAKERVNLWQSQQTLIGQVLTYKHFPVGAKDKPNLPGFVSFRDLEDL